MHTKASVFLAESIVIGCALIVIAALILAFSPMLWTDHFMTYDTTHFTRPMPSGCTIQTSQYVAIAHCPFWVNWPY
jgi:hypothetical protein